MLLGNTKVASSNGKAARTCANSDDFGETSLPEPLDQDFDATRLHTMRIDDHDCVPQSSTHKPCAMSIQAPSGENALGVAARV